MRHTRQRQTSSICSLWQLAESGFLCFGGRLIHWYVFASSESHSWCLSAQWLHWLPEDWLVYLQVQNSLPIISDLVGSMVFLEVHVCHVPHFGLVWCVDLLVSHWDWWSLVSNWLKCYWCHCCSKPQTLCSWTSKTSQKTWNETSL